jgi:modulator of FtsH protease
MNDYKHLRNVYIILALQIIITMFIVNIIRNNPKYYYLVQSYSAIPIILSFILLFIIQLSNFSKKLKLFLLTLFSICLGMICIATSYFISNSTINSALKSTLAIFISLSLVGWLCSIYNINLNKLQFILLISLLGLIIGMIFSTRTPQNMRVIFTFGVVLFSIFIAYDTFRILQSKKKDVISDSLGLYLSILNLFQNLVGLKSTN